ncbi:DUF6850 family outer membrane beta-barrel protein [Pedobacter sp.]|uniref:DUF6850 family outer membrane beta-barrel protein n=1 Tax=Pedobacter sp. TaxID=1411316 RepID=UPI003BABB473
MINRKFLQILIILIFFSVLVKAQSGKDSVYFFYQDQKILDNSLFSPTFSSINALKSYGFLQLDFKREAGSFRRAQEAYSVNMPKFLAKGFNVLGKFRIAGSFEFNNSIEDSLANGQKNNLEDFTTYYPYANKSGNYKRQNYIVKTSLSYSALKNHLIPFVNLDYQKHQSSGTVDPRLSSKRFIFKVKPGVNFQFKNNAVGVYGLIGKADEQVSLGYKNDNYKTSLLYPDRIHYMNYGYGASVIKDSSNVYKFDNYKGFGIQYTTNFKDWDLQIATEYQLYQNKNYNKTRTMPGFATVGIFNLNTINGSLLLSKKIKDKTSQLFLLDFAYNEGYDGNLKTSGSLNKVNYRVNALNFNAAYHFLWNKNKKVSKELGINFSYDQNDKQDLIQADGLSYEQIKLGLNSTLYYTIDQQSRFKVSLSPYYIEPINASLKFNPNSMTEFIKNVVFTDYYYYNSKSIGAEVAGEYISSKLIKKQRFGFYSQLNLRKILSQELRKDLNPTFVPNGKRSIFHIGVNMYL